MNKNIFQSLCKSIFNRLLGLALGLLNTKCWRLRTAFVILDPRRHWFSFSTSVRKADSWGVWSWAWADRCTTMGRKRCPRNHQCWVLGHRGGAHALCSLIDLDLVEKHLHGFPVVEGDSLAINQFIWRHCQHIRDDILLLRQEIVVFKRLDDASLKAFRTYSSSQTDRIDIWMCRDQLV